MTAQSKKRTPIVEISDGGLGLGLAAFIANGEDLGPMIRQGFDCGKPEALMHSLRGIVKKKEVEIEELCRLHYEDFILAVDELRDVMVDAEELKSMLAAENSHLQQVTSALLLKLDELFEAYSIKKNVGEAITILKICVKVISLCMSCNNYIAEVKFHPALKTLELIEKGYLQNIPVKLLKTVVGRQIPLIKLHIEKKACGEFNDWLVHIRRMAKQIGQVSINHASLARQKEEEMRARQKESEENSHAGPDEHMYTLDLENTDEETALDFDVTPVYRAHHIHIYASVLERSSEIITTRTGSCNSTWTCKFPLHSPSLSPIYLLPFFYSQHLSVALQLFILHTKIHVTINFFEVSLILYITIVYVDFSCPYEGL